ncbi:MAG: aldose epimerase family protein [Ferruginibacter sp.]
MNISKKPFGNFENDPVTEYTLQNANGMQVSIINYGATITKIIAADRQNVFANVINGFDTLADYLSSNNPYMGCIVGRYCNRIAHGKFVLDGKEYNLAKNHGEHSLHGGHKGFDKVLWNAEPGEATNSLKLNYLSKDGEEGFPGNLNITVIYSLTNNNELKIDYSATTDRSTPVNFTNHCYFNLSGDNNTPITDHELQLFADNYTATDPKLIPTGEIASVKNTGLDFSSAKKVGKEIAAIGGYDHNMIINKNDNAVNDLVLTANLYEPVSGRHMQMFTTEPAVQFYSGNQNPGQQFGLCLEAQHYPDSPNKPSFPNTILKPGELYRQTTVYKFSNIYDVRSKM